MMLGQSGLARKAVGSARLGKKGDKGTGPEPGLGSRH